MLSPTGRFEVTFYDREVFNTHWVQTPTLVDKQTGEPLFAFKDTHWSVDERSWLDDAKVRFHLRKYPGNHDPGEIMVTLDCATRMASFNGVVCGFDELEQRLDAALTWIYARPETPEPAAGLRGALRRLFKGN
ncbi:MAG TPA: hypothetical protein VM146_07375 [Steroidobacteraceae bacterium]|nr:hypothetical protein [Steroidobacteraceae bacterium]